MYQPPPAVDAGQLKQCADVLLRESPPLELRQCHPADLGDALAVCVVGPQRHGSRDHVQLGLIRHDQLCPGGVRCHPLNITLDLGLHAFASEQRARSTLSGGSWTSYYDEAEVTDAKKLDIDHMVPLAKAWDSGSHDRTPEHREAYANDLGAERSLVAVTAKTNRSKADKDPAAWMPPAEAATCTYLVDWTATKLRWNLSADETEQAALLDLAEPCADSTVKYEPAP